MDLDLALKEFQEFQDTARKIHLKIEEAEPINLELNQFPKFYLPDWPEKMPILTVHLGLSRPWFLEKNPETTLYRLKKKIMAIDVKVACNKLKGYITVTCSNPLDLQNFIIFHSDSDTAVDRLNCFVIFCQTLKKGGAKITAVAKRMLKKTDSETADTALVMENIKKSLEPFIPFLIADQLSERI